MISLIVVGYYLVFPQVYGSSSVQCVVWDSARAAAYSMINISGRLIFDFSFQLLICKYICLLGMQYLASSGHKEQHSKPLRNTVQSQSSKLIWFVLGTERLFLRCLPNAQKEQLHAPHELEIQF